MNNETRFDIHWTVRGTDQYQYGVTRMELDMIKSGILYDAGTMELDMIKSGILYDAGTIVSIHEVETDLSSM
jgi:hypothetical protein